MREVWESESLGRRNRRRGKVVLHTELPNVVGYTLPKRPREKGTKIKEKGIGAYQKQAKWPEKKENGKPERR